MITMTKEYENLEKFTLKILDNSSVEHVFKCDRKKFFTLESDGDFAVVQARHLANGWHPVVYAIFFRPISCKMYQDIE